jgi:hypothetical protein
VSDGSIYKYRSLERNMGGRREGSNGTKGIKERKV